MAHKKGCRKFPERPRQRRGQRLGVKVFGGQFVTAGSIIVRQRGTRIHPGDMVRRAKDDSLFCPGRRRRDLPEHEQAPKEGQRLP